jgi:hypothetical protein
LNRGNLAPAGATRCAGAGARSFQVGPDSVKPLISGPDLVANVGHCSGSWR